MSPERTARTAGILLWCLVLILSAGVATAGHPTDGGPAEWTGTDTTSEVNQGDRQMPNGSAMATDIEFDSPSVDRPPIVGREVTVSSAVTVPDIFPLRTEEADLTLELAVDGSTVETKTVTIAEGETTPLSLSHTFAAAGNHTVAVSGSVTFGGQTYSDQVETAVTVVDRSVDITGVAVDPSPAVGEQTTVGVNATTPDVFPEQSVQQTMDVNLSVDGSVVDTESVTVTDGSTTPVSFDYTFGSAGDHDVSVSSRVTFDGVAFTGTASRSITAVDPTLSLTDISVDPRPTVGNQTNVATDLSLSEIVPDQRVSADAEVALRVDGSTVRSDQVSVTEGETTPLSSAHTFQSAGNHTVALVANVTIDGYTLSGTVTRTVTVESGVSSVAANVSRPAYDPSGAITANLSVPDVPNRDLSGNATVELRVGGEVVASQDLSVADGENASLRLAYEPPTAGTQSVTLVVNGSVGDVSLSDAVTTELAFGETLTGVTFAVPPSLEDEVSDLRSSLDRTPPNVTVLATPDSLYLVFTDTATRTGNATVEGLVLDTQREEAGRTFGVVRASNLTYAAPKRVSIEAITSDPDAYRLEAVRVTDTYRRLATLFDPDAGGSLTVSQTAGVLGGPADPFAGNLGARVSSLLSNVSTSARGGNYSAEISGRLEQSINSRLPTVGATTAFWASARTQVDGVVIVPGSRASAFLQSFGRGNQSYDGERPILYRTGESFEPTPVDNVTSLSKRSEALAGDVVSVEAKLYQGRLSVQETLEHATTSQCSPDRLLVQTPQGPVCVNVPVDTLLHGGVAWNGVPTDRDDLLFVVGASSRHQDRPFRQLHGTYRIVGTVRDTSDVSGRLPNASVLVVHDLERTGSFTLGGDARALARNRTRSMIETLRGQLNSSLSALESRLPVDIRDVVTERVGDKRELSATVDVPDVLPGRTASGTAETRLLIGDQVVATREITVTEGESASVTLTFEVPDSAASSATLVVNGSVASRNVSASTTVSLSLGQQFEGASFSVPESLEDEVAEYKTDTDRALPTNVSVMATPDSLYLVFTDAVPQTGRINVTGISLNQTLNERGLSFGVVVARNTTYETTGTPTTVSAVASDPDSYRLDLVRLNATHRQTTLLGDPDTGSGLTVAGTAGVVSAAPVNSQDLLSALAAKARTLVVNGSVARRPGSLSGTVTQFVGADTDQRLPITSLRTDFWVDANATVDALVLSPGTPARRFLTAFDPTNSTNRADGVPLLYRAQRSLDPVTVDSVADLSAQSRSLSGDVVSLEAKLYQERVSVQETVEHATTTQCSERRLTVETPEGPVCVNVAVDTLVHGGVAWTTTLPGTDDVVPVVGVSSRHQDAPSQTLRGEYRIVGEVVTASQVNASLPDEPMLVAYDLQRVGDLDLVEETVALVSNETADLVGTLRGSISEQAPSETRPGRIAGSVDTNGTAAQNVTVLAVDASEGPALNRSASALDALTDQAVATTTVSADGGYELTLDAGRYRLVAFDASAGVASGVETVQTNATGVDLLLSGSGTTPPPVTGGSPPGDTDGDGRFEDVNGDGRTGLFDALSYYNNRDSAAIENHPDAFDFDGDGRSGTLFDALALYNQVS